MRPERIRIMTDRKKQLLEIMEYCVPNGEFCSDCPNRDQDYEGCRAMHEEFFNEVKRSWESEGTAT